MSNQKRNQPKDKPLDPRMIESLLNVQLRQLEIDKRSQDIRIEEAKINAKLAEKSMALQEKVLLKQPSEYRKTVAVYIGFVITTIILILGFLAYCIHTENTDFAIKFVQIAGYFITTIVGYYLGRKSSKSPQKKEDEIQEAEVVD